MAIGQMKLLDMKITSQWIEDAKMMAQQAEERRKEVGFTTQRFDASTDYIGRIGERAFHWFLENELGLNSSQFDWMNSDKDRLLPYDFIVRNGSRDFRVDVKSAGPTNSFDECQRKIHHWSYLYPVTSKVQEKDLVVLVYIWESARQCCLVGFIETSVVERCPVRTCPVEGSAERYPIENYIIKPIAQLFMDMDDFREFLEL